VKKGQIIEGIVECVEFPNKGIVRTEDGGRVIVKNAVPGQKVSASINKVRKGKCEGRLLKVLERSAKEQPEAACIHAGECGGCTYQTLPYEEQLAMKASQVKKLIDDVIVPENTDYEFLGIKASPRQQEYRNKMEFSFGDAYKGGPLALGMHKRGSFYDIVDVPECRIVDDDFHTVLTVTLDYFKERNLPYYHKLRHTGYLRHLLVRKAVKTGEILVDLVTTTQISEGEEEALLAGWKEALCAAAYRGTLTGVLHTRNDSVADTVKNEGTDVLFGQDHFYEELLGLRFQITPFSFFQTNSLGAEVLYETAREFIGDALPSGTDADVAEHGKVVFDLYSGTGTIAQMLAPVAKKVIGVDIIPEAVEAAKENAKLNSLTNCEFIAGDVLKVIDEIEEKPDYIVLDPPRDGIHPKALEKIIRYGVPQMVYISCKPTSLARDLEVLQARGYEVKKVCCVDMFPATVHVETVVLLSHKKPDGHINVKVEFGEGEGKVPLDNIAKRAEEYKPKERVTYKMIKEYIEAKYGFKVHTAYIAEVKRDLGLPMYDAPNAVEELKQPRKHPTAEKVEAIKDALKHFEVI
jgi:23S rRNA (uracil1939-C5)-methyltransferase